MAHACGLQVDWLGRVRYEAGLELQSRAVKARLDGTGGDRLLLLEHPPAVTLGRSARESNLLLSREAIRARGIDLHEVQRGGDVTYHAPGQLVGYLVMDLKARGQPDVHLFVRRMESALIETLAALGLRGRAVPGRTGVFMGAVSEGDGAEPPRKIASIGIGVRKWVTFHGFALNVTLDLSGFDVIVPCGLDDITMTSVAQELGRGSLGLDARVRAQVCATFPRVFA